MGKKKGLGVLLTVGAAAAAAALTKKARDIRAENQRELQMQINEKRDYTHLHAYFIGGGLAGMAGAVYLLRDCNFRGENIRIYEYPSQFRDEKGPMQRGYVCEGGWLYGQENHENFWNVLSAVPSLEKPQMSVAEEIRHFAHAHPISEKMHFVDQAGKRIETEAMGLSREDRKAVGKLLLVSEEKLDDITVEEWFAQTPHFFKTNLWYRMQSIFGFQKWSGALAFRGHIKRVLLDASGVGAPENIISLPLDAYDSIYRPLRTFLEKKGVQFIQNGVVTDIDFSNSKNITVQAFHFLDKEGVHKVEINPKDLCIVTNGCSSDCSVLGSLDTPARFQPAHPASGDLWSKIAAKKPELGQPNPFFGNPEESNREDFTITMRNDRLLKILREYLGDKDESSGFITFKDSSWRLNIAIENQPRFANQEKNQTVIWGYGLYINHFGDYIKKPMRNCTGRDIFAELMYHLHLSDRTEEFLVDVIDVIPCMRPYAAAQLQPRKMGDRPPVVPDYTRHFACIGQFTEIPEDVVSMEEYAVYTARTAVYTLLDIPKEVCSISSYKMDPRAVAQALKLFLIIRE